MCGTGTGVLGLEKAIVGARVLMLGSAGGCVANIAPCREGRPAGTMQSALFARVRARRPIFNEDELGNKLLAYLRKFGPIGLGVNFRTKMGRLLAHFLEKRAWALTLGTGILACSFFYLENS